MEMGTAGGVLVGRFVGLVTGEGLGGRGGLAVGRATGLVPLKRSAQKAVRVR